MDAHNTCTWLVERREEFFLGDDYGWELGDLIAVPCGAKVTELPNGWECEAGHSHFANVEYFDDDEVDGMIDRGIFFPANAYRVNGTRI